MESRSFFFFFSGLRWVSGFHDTPNLDYRVVKGRGFPTIPCKVP